MNLVVCLDDLGGMTFGGKRLSRDRLLIDDLMATIGAHRLLISPYSAPLFEAYPEANVVVDADYLTLAQPGDTCFVEREALLPYASQIERLTVYKWNRRYPAMTFFDLPLENWTLHKTTEFVGSSHETITKESYIK